MKKLIIHAGTHKTGTTAIQRIMHSSKEALQMEGIYWPEIKGKFNHHNFIVAVDNSKGNIISKFKEWSIRSKIEKAPENTHTTIISSEKIYRMGFEFFGHESQKTLECQERRNEFLKKLSSQFANYDITLVLYLRRVDEFAESLYKELSFKKKYIGPYHFETFLDEQSVLFEYNKRIKEFEKYFSNVKLLSYNYSNNVGLINSFCSLIGARAFSNDLANKRVRTGPSNIAALVMEEISKQKKITYRFRRWLLDFSLSEHWPEPKNNLRRSIWHNKESHMEFLSQYECKELEDLFLPVDWTKLEHKPLSKAELEFYFEAIAKAGGFSISRTGME